MTQERHFSATVPETSAAAEVLETLIIAAQYQRAPKVRRVGPDYIAQ